MGHARIIGDKVLMEDETLLRLPSVMAMTGRNKWAIYRDPTFPKTVQTGPRTVAWLKSEIQRWVAERIEHRGPNNITVAAAKKAAAASVAMARRRKIGPRRAQRTDGTQRAEAPA